MPTPAAGAVTPFAVADTVGVVNHIQWIEPRPTLRHPILVLAFEGWNDAGDAASGAAHHLARQVDAQPLARIEPEEFYDFSTTRPMVSLENGRRTIRWPAPELEWAHLPEAENDLVILTGIEPQFRWRTFANTIIELAQSLEVSMVVSLGALIADVAHSRPTTVFGSSDNPDLAKRLDLTPSSYEGPTGIIGVLGAALGGAGFAMASLWGSVPSYVPHARSPKAALALVDHIATLLHLPILGGDLIEESAEYEAQIGALVNQDDETRAYVANLEAAYDQAYGPESSAALIEDLEKFLRDQQ